MVTVLAAVWGLLCLLYASFVPASGIAPLTRGLRVWGFGGGLSRFGL